MFGRLEIFQTAIGMAKHASARQAKIAANLANADTPGYRAQDVKPFSETYQAGSSSDGLRATRPGHHLGPVTGQGAIEAFYRPDGQSPGGNSVSIEREMVEAVRAQSAHNRAITIYQSALGIMRSSVRTGR
ncbi:Flagellar basal-body rod protein FlgB [Candidatus Rhodobacter oscarellae]|uniref:Flagellar basal-body rod protein FlgB n=1 Tax=Candidatus Rhodobacter oscarellae TaxID=1675527 RepID=A0A0J9EC00_9RHOB|nr:FlgB family protein [Candidatus Rhodobacter lobularis]KMW59214.1 Flagellar basal-body rod protein FlgB [Candidatus Rhodobacter lobularis]